MKSGIFGSYECKFEPIQTHDMKTQKRFARLLAILLLLPNLPSAAQKVSTVEPFLGMWALDLDYDDSNAGWLEVRQEEGYLDAEILWRWGSVYPVENTMVVGDMLLLTHGSDVVRKKDSDGNALRTHHPIYWFEITKEGSDMIRGNAVFPNASGIGAEQVSFTGKKIPPYSGKKPDPKKADYGNPVKLFNGKNLDGWELLGAGSTSGWRVENGVLVNDPVQKQGKRHINYGNLRTTATFEDFNLTLEVNVPEGSNSGIYLRGIYEVQVMDSHGNPLDPHNMGALYSRITPLVAAEKPAGEWQDMEITLYKRYLTVKLNGTTIIDNQPVKGVTGGALTADETLPGPLYLQGDHGKVSYRNIVLTPIEK
ncbi:MAG: DUF1080 domain-containing protein [Bacteroidetes bacterium]|nr:MAG: DUF1080 domain-containing protein [Bacteroidota bacterium]